MIEQSIDQRAAHAIRALAMDAVEAANSGHPGMPMGMADLAQVLWVKHLKHCPSDPRWMNRDRFVLSNGHGSMLLYALLHLTGYEISVDDLRAFRQLHAKTAGHPEYDLAYGIEMTTGPLGQGLATAVGMALAEKILAAKYNQENYPVIDHYTYVFCGDGDLMEGVSHEACALAGTWQLNKMIVIWDDNNISIDGPVQDWMTTNVAQRFKAYGWHVIDAIDGHDPAAIDQAITAAKAQYQRPTLICAKTHIGYGCAKVQDTAKAHGAPLGAQAIAATKAALGWPHAAFEIPEDIYHHFNAQQRGEQALAQWQAMWDQYEAQYPQLAQQCQQDVAGEIPAAVLSALQSCIDQAIATPSTLATRQASAAVIAAFAPALPSLTGGSADLTGSNGTAWPTMTMLEPHQKDGFAANYIRYGVREFGMSAIMNGLQLHGGLRVFGGTFLAFSDYARPAVRLSALMQNPVIYVYTHDSIGLGEDGPTHQPVEQLDSLRLMPNLTVWRPADMVETTVAWSCALQSSNPTVLCLSRQKVPAVVRDQQLASHCHRGAYVLLAAATHPDIVLFASGTEVSLALETAALLEADNHHVQVVSVPSMEQFWLQDAAYQAQVLGPNAAKKVALEAGIAALWAPFVGTDGLVCGVDTFGHSAPYQQIYAHFGLTPAALVATITK